MSKHDRKRPRESESDVTEVHQDMPSPAHSTPGPAARAPGSSSTTSRSVIDENSSADDVTSFMEHFIKSSLFVPTKCVVTSTGPHILTQNLEGLSTCFEPLLSLKNSRIL